MLVTKMAKSQTTVHLDSLERNFMEQNLVHRTILAEDIDILTNTRVCIYKLRLVSPPYIKIDSQWTQ